MKNITLFVVALFCFPAWATEQPNDSLNRKIEIERFIENICSATELRRVADSLQLSVSELSDYPIIFPVKEPYISSGFGGRKHPIYKVWKFHTGIDFAEAKGIAVYATGNGTVIRKGYDSGYGLFIEIQHAGGFHSFYAHLSKTLVKTGDSITIGKHIACVGNSGVTTGNHLHYEIRKGNRFLNPIEWCCCLLEVLNR